MNPTAIYSKSGKGVQEASGKTNLLRRPERAVLSAIDGRATLAEVAQKVGKPFDAAFQALITQLDRDGFVRAVSGGTPAQGGRGAPATSSGLDLDFTTIMPIPKAAPPPKTPASPAPLKAPTPDVTQRLQQESALYKARQEAEARAQAERDRLRAEAEAKARAELEAKIRADAEKKLREEAEARARAGTPDAKAKAARDAALKVAAEAKARAEAEKARLEAERAKLEAERKAREEAERKAREEAERARREAEELRQRLEEERKAREEAERRAREEAERRAREEEERRRREEEERRAREEAERRAREEEERLAREEAERKAREEEERRRRAEEEERARQAREDEERSSRARHEEEERARHDEEERVRREAEEARAAARPEPAPAAKAAATGSLDNLMADLDSFSRREQDDRSSREAAEAKAKEEMARRQREDAERRAQEQAQAERRQAEERRQADERRRREEEQRREQEETERRMREAEQARAQEAAARQAPQAEESDDIGVTEADLGMDDVRRDEALISSDARKAQREREREAKEREREARQREREARQRERRDAEAPLKAPKPPRKPVKWGKPLGITLLVVLLAGVGALHIVPIPAEPYERAASQALGVPVRIGAARLSPFTCLCLSLERVRIGESGSVATVRAYPELGSLVDERMKFRRIELDGATLAPQALGEAMFARMKGADFTVGKVVAKQLKIAGGLALPPLEAEALIGPDGAVRSIALQGPEELLGKITPGAGRIEFDVTAGSFALPVAPNVNLKSFAMKGSATRQGMNIASWGGAIFDGALTGAASVRWAGGWQVDGVFTVRNVNAAVFAPALLSEGRAEGTGRFSMSAADPAKLAGGSRIEGRFTVHKGVLGSFDLSRLIQTSGRQATGRTQFAEMTGQGVYERGAVALREVQISAGALNAGASADIAQSGALSGRIVVDVKTATQTLRQTIVLGGTVKEPQVRN